MILGRTGSSLVALALICVCGPARADVLEIGTQGARWIAGGQNAPAADTPDPATPANIEQLSADYPLPLEALADPAVAAASVPDAYEAKVHELARRFDLSPALIEALVWQESRWRANAVSSAGARGLAQLMPATARELGVNPDDPFANLEGGARYLREQLDRFDGDLEKALAAYNAGPGRVEEADGIPNISETRHYVAAVMGRLADHSRR